MVIQWYPGHMAKAKREATENVKLVDLVIEIRDARIPESSANPMVEEIIGDKPRLVVFGKNDLAQLNVSNAWSKKLQLEGQDNYFLNVKDQIEMAAFKKFLRKYTDPIRQKWLDKEANPRPVRLMVLGVPNVGKSTFINQFVNRKRAQTGDRPGVTKRQEWIQVDQHFDLLDTPGILWPKFEDQNVGRKLAATGGIKDTIFHADDIALFLIDYFKEDQFEGLAKRYNLAPEDQNLDRVELLLKLTEKMGLRGDFDLASERMLQDYQAGRLGRLSLDRLDD